MAWSCIAWSPSGGISPWSPSSEENEVFMVASSVSGLPGSSVTPSKLTKTVRAVPETPVVLAVVSDDLAAVEPDSSLVVPSEEVISSPVVVLGSGRAVEVDDEQVDTTLVDPVSSSTTSLVVWHAARRLMVAWVMIRARSRTPRTVSPRLSFSRGAKDEPERPDELTHAGA